MKKIINKIFQPYYKKFINKIDEAINKNITIEELKENIKNLEYQIDENKQKLYYFDNLKNNIIFTNNKTLYLKNTKIRIIFLFQIASFWPSWESVYEEIKNNEKFDFKLCLLEVDGKEPSQMKTARKFLEDNNIMYDFYSEELLEKFKPHIIIMQTPYDDWHRIPTNDSNYFIRKGIRLIYIPYGIEISDAEESIKLQYDNNFIRNMWKVYTLSDEMKKEYITHGNLLRNSVLALGHPKFDGIYNKTSLVKKDYKKEYKNKKIILLKVHFKREINIGNGKREIVTPNVLVYLKFLKECFIYKNCLILFMAHPKFYDDLDENIRKEIKEIIKNSNNIIEYNNDDYREALYVSDMMIIDRSAILIEAGALSKPILYIYNKKYKETFTESLKPLINSYYSGTDTKDLHSFVKKILKGEDNLKSQRDSAFKYAVPYYDGKCGIRIVDDIINSMNIEK